jgi:hypothetical protein
MKRYEVSPGRFVPASPSNRPELCLCKPWHICSACGLVEHAGSFCSYCKRKDTLERVVTRPFSNLTADSRQPRALSATATSQEAA